MAVASYWGTGGYGTQYILLCRLQQEMRYIVHTWGKGTKGDHNFGNTTHVIRLLLESNPDVTIFIKDEVDEWEAVFRKHGKKAAKFIPPAIGFDKYEAQVIEDLQVIKSFAGNKDPRSVWEAVKEKDIRYCVALKAWDQEYALNVYSQS